MLLCFFRSCDLVYRMEGLEILLRIWYTIWACQKPHPKWLLLKISCISNKIRRFHGKHVQKEDLLHTHEASQRGYQNLCTLNLIYVQYHMTFILTYLHLDINFQVRRTRISERIKRLQELFPDMDKVSFPSLKCKSCFELLKNKKIKESILLIFIFNYFAAN